MEQAERLCERVCLISKSRKVLDDNIRDLKRRERSGVVAGCGKWVVHVRCSRRCLNLTTGIIRLQAGPVKYLSATLRNATITPVVDSTRAATGDRETPTTGPEKTRMSASYYPDTVSLRLPPGTKDRIGRLARNAGRSPADWLREAVRRAVENAERTERRRQAARTKR